MPELPEVETIRQDLAKKIKGERIKKVEILDKKLVRNSSSFFINSLLDKSIVSVNRIGKLLYLELSGPNKVKNYLLLHLKMTGQIILVALDEKIVGGHSLAEDSFEASIGGPLPNKYTRLIFTFSSGELVYFNDLRRFAYAQIVNQKQLDQIMNHNYGPEPLAKGFDLEYLTKVLAKRTTNIKALLLNQKIIAGLGNIYVDEALFLAKIKPTRIAGRLSLVERANLVEAIKSVIALAIKKRGTTFNNYRDAKGRKGNFASLLQVYGRSQQPCLVCGREIKKIKLAGRGTHFCPHCQR